MPSLRHANPTEVPSKEANREKRASFAANPVSGVSRPVTAPEHRAISEFEYHARSCALCHRPYDVYKAGEQLCERGHHYAQEVAVYLYNEEGDTFSTIKEDLKHVRVELSEGYDEVRGLLKAIERSLRHRRRAPFVSMDRSYYIPPRTTEQRSHVKVKISQPKRPQSGEIVDWPKPIPVERRAATVDIHTSRTSKRGSLYDSDIAQQKRDYIKYRVEVREPSKGTSGYYR